MSLLKKLVLSFTILFCAPIFYLVSAQEQSLSFTNYSVKDGMSHGIVDDLFRDSEGFLWVATYDGLNRFDGTGFKVFHADRRNPHAIVDNYVQDVCEDTDGNIWCGCDKGVSRYNKSTGTFTNYHLVNPNGSIVDANKVYNILCDRHGTIWCSSWAGVFEYDKQQDTFKGYYHSKSDSASISNESVYKNSFAEDPVKDGIWMSGPSGINFLDTKTKKFYNYGNNPKRLAVFSADNIYPISFDTEENLWFAVQDKSGLNCFHFESNIVTRVEIKTDEPHAKPLGDIATILFDSKNNLWVSTWKNRLCYRENGSSIFKCFSHDESNAESINSDFFWDVLEDADGTLWFGGLNGISRFQPSGQYYSLIRPNKSLPENLRFKWITAIFQNNDTLLWLGTDAGLYSYNLITGGCRSFRPPEGGNDVLYINRITEIDHQLWLATKNGVSFFDLQTKKFLRKNFLPEELTDPNIFIDYVHASLNGDIWILSHKKRELYRFQKSSHQWTDYKHEDTDPHSVSAVVLPALYEEKNGNMWFGTFEDGLMRFDESKNSFDFFRTGYDDTSKIRIANLLRICGGNDGELYLLPGRSGVIRFHPNDSTAKLYMQSDGLATESNYDLLKDRYGNFWLAGYREVTMLDTRKNSFSRFRIDYANTNYYYENVMIAMLDGKVGISILDAIAICNPETIQKEYLVPSVLISDFSVFEKSIPYSQKNPNVILQYNQNFFNISFSSFAAVQSGSAQYAYMLEGFDPDWVYCGDRNFASYTNVPGGDYTFLVKAGTADGKWNDTTTMVHITIIPPFWQTNWFRIVVLLGFLTLVSLIFKIRERNMRAQQEQKLRLYKVRDKIARDLHDDIGASLSSIRMYSEAVRTQLKEKVPDANVILERISNNAKEIVENMSDIVWAINPKNDSLQLMEDRMRAFVSELCASKNIIPHFNQVDFHELKLPMEMRKNIFLIFKEAVNNAVKYSDCKSLTFYLGKSNDMLMMEIKDDGRGFDEDLMHTGNGLLNMKKRTEEIGGELFVHSKQGEGTSVLLKLKLP